ncbi:MAG: ABC transporter substrate-binding protein [Planctomycetes bacterium]|nr:ABC transporter substrate-binding protein [Planctomycetota bacterium]
MPRVRSLRAPASAALLAAAACGAGSTAGPDDLRPAAPPQRIVAGSLLAAEVLLELAPRRRLAGVHSLAADPHFSLVAAEASGLPLVGAEPEQLLAARPDLVVVDAFTRPETVAILRSAGVPILRTAPAASFADVAANVLRIGRACHLDDAAEGMAKRLHERVDEVRAAGAGLAAWRVCSLDGALHTYGQGSLFDAVVTTAGATHLAAQRGVGPFRKLDVEALLAWQPDALVIGCRPGGEQHERAWLRQVHGLQHLACVQKDRLVFVPGPLLGATSPRLVEAAVLLQERLRAWGKP